MVEFTLTKLFDEVLKGHWDNVVDIYEHIKGAAQLKINSSGDTALHKAVSDGREHIVEQLVKALRAEVKDALELTNNHGNTPLHLAAAMGNIPMCKCMTGEHIDLLDQRNNNGHTPLFLTVLHGKLDAFIFLCEICKPNGIERYYRGGKFGATILHTAVNGEHFKLAFHIMNNHKELMNWMDERGSTPLHLLADKPSVFRSGAYFGWRENIIYSCITVKELPDLILPDEINNQTGQQSRNTEFPSDRWFPPTYRKCCYFLNLIYSVLLVIFGWGKLVSNSRANGENAKNSGQVGDAENPKELEDESLCIPCFRFSGGNGDNAKRHGQTGLAGNAKELPKGEDQLKFPPNYRTGIELMKLVFKLMLIILGLGYEEIQKIKHMKEKHVWSVQILKKMLESTRIYGYDAGGRSGPSTSTSGEGHALMENFTEFPPVETNGKAKDADDKHEPGLDRSETPILTAARTGIKEIVELILKHFPVAIHDMNSQKKNIVLLAAENRQPHLIDLLIQKNSSESVFHTVDIKGNSALHLAANYDPSLNPWTLPGAALQMQWEIKWYEIHNDRDPGK
eukprot:XP_019078408.1 PREDICTED: uncharacterized protein LOC100854873 isoform X2 [Vitis vinifera]